MGIRWTQPRHSQVSGLDGQCVGRELPVSLIGPEQRGCLRWHDGIRTLTGRSVALLGDSSLRYLPAQERGMLGTDARK